MPGLYIDPDVSQAQISAVESAWENHEPTDPDVLPEEGKYPASILDIQLKTSKKGGGCPYAILAMQRHSAPGPRFTGFLSFSPNALWKVDQLFNALQIETDGKRLIDILNDEVSGRIVGVRVVHKEDTRTFETVNQVTGAVGTETRTQTRANLTFHCEPAFLNTNINTETKKEKDTDDIPF